MEDQNRETRLLVISDSHGNVPRLKKIVECETAFHYIVHCGDGAGDLFHISLPEGISVLRVSGNVDLARGMTLERYIVEDIAGWKIFITHGDLQGAHRDYLGLIDEGRSRGCGLVLFGHTHRPYLAGKNPVLFNPGTAQHGQYGIVCLSSRGMDCLHRVMEM